MTLNADNVSPVVQVWLMEIIHRAKDVMCMPAVWAALYCTMGDLVRLLHLLWCGMMRTEDVITAHFAK